MGISGTLHEVCLLLHNEPVEFIAFVANGTAVLCYEQHCNLMHKVAVHVSI